MAPFSFLLKTVATREWPLWLELRGCQAGPGGGVCSLAEEGGLLSDRWPCPAPVRRVCWDLGVRYSPLRLPTATCSLHSLWLGLGECAEFCGGSGDGAPGSPLPGHLLLLGGQGQPGGPPDPVHGRRDGDQAPHCASLGVLWGPQPVDSPHPFPRAPDGGRGCGVCGGRGGDGGSGPSGRCCWRVCVCAFEMLPCHLLLNREKGGRGAGLFIQPPLRSWFSTARQGGGSGGGSPWCSGV